jgi:SAM-dependent methyltransferase
MTAFDPRGYWEERLARHYTHEGVGFLGLAEAYNRWMYRVRGRVFTTEAGRLVRDASRQRVLDIGSGTGFYIDRWHEVGVGHVTGSDLTDVAVANLRRRHPTDTFARFDVGEEGHPFGSARFSVVTAMDVLYHVVDDRRFAHAFANVFQLLEPGGYFVFSENFVHGEAVRIPHQASRSLGEIERAATDAGFEILRRRPVFYLMNAPIDSNSRLRHAWWRLLKRLARRDDWVGAGVGAGLYPFELALVSRLPEGPSTELMVCRRPAAGRDKPEGI